MKRYMVPLKTQEVRAKASIWVLWRIDCVSVVDDGVLLAATSP